MTAVEVRERGLERIARGDFDAIPDGNDQYDPYQTVKEYAGWLLRQTGNQDEPTPPEPRGLSFDPDHKRSQP